MKDSLMVVIYFLIQIGFFVGAVYLFAKWNYSFVNNWNWLTMILLFILMFAGVFLILAIFGAASAGAISSNSEGFFWVIIAANGLISFSTLVLFLIQVVKSLIK